MGVSLNDPTRIDRQMLFTDTLAADGATPWRLLQPGVYNVSMAPSDGTAALQCSYDGGVTPFGVVPLSITVADDTTGNVSFPVEETETNVLYRMAVTGLTTGVASLRISGAPADA